MQYPKTFAAAKRAEKSQWAIGDALLEEIGPPRAGKAQESQFAECARELSTAGMPYGTAYLRELRNIAYKFNPASRDAGLTARNAMGAGTPKVFEKARELAEAEGKPLTQRFIEKVAKSTRSMDRKSTRTAKTMPTPKPVKRAHERPVSEIRHHSDVLALTALAGDAAKSGKTFVQKIAGFDLTDDEREELVESIDRTLKVWTAARDAVANPIAAGAEAFLRGSNR
jgi:hypothetical protein